MNRKGLYTVVYNDYLPYNMDDLVLLNFQEIQVLFPSLHWSPPPIWEKAFCGFFLKIYIDHKSRSDFFFFSVFLESYNILILNSTSNMVNNSSLTKFCICWCTTVWSKFLYILTHYFNFLCKSKWKALKSVSRVNMDVGALRIKRWSCKNQYSVYGISKFKLFDWKKNNKTIYSCWHALGIP